MKHEETFFSKRYEKSFESKRDVCIMQYDAHQYKVAEVCLRYTQPKEKPRTFSVMAFGCFGAMRDKSARRSGRCGRTGSWRPGSIVMMGTIMMIITNRRPE